MGIGVKVLIINNSKKPNTLRDHLPGPVLSALYMCICPHSYPRGYYFHCEGEGVSTHVLSSAGLRLCLSGLDPSDGLAWDVV